MNFNQAKELGGSIKNGAKGLPVIYCKMVTKNQVKEGAEGDGKGYFWGYPGWENSLTSPNRRMRTRVHGGAP